jgi:RecJ-like exonuclease
VGKIVRCPGCNGVGVFRDVKCEKCKETGKIDCKARGCTREVKPPTLETFADLAPCKVCDGKGTLTRHIALACPECLGIGLIIRPKADPSKLLK